MSKTCFLCSSTTLDCIQIFSIEGQSRKIAEIVNKHFWFELKPSGAVDLTSICKNCWQLTLIFHVFYCRIENKYWGNGIKDTDDNENNVSEHEQAVVYDFSTNKPLLNEFKNSPKSANQEISAYDSNDDVPDYFMDRLNDDSNDITHEISESAEKIADRKPSHTVDRSVLHGNRAKWENIDYDILSNQMRLYFEMKCTVCSHRFETYDDALLHTRDVHNKIGYLLCCKSKIRIHPKSILAHIQKHVDPMKFQ